MSTTWFTADFHFSHERILSLADRPFGSVDEMNEVMIERYNAVVSEEDTVWILGDVALGVIAESLPLAKRLKGRKFLIAGNHDRCFAPAQSDPDRCEQWRQAYVEQGGFSVVVTGNGTLSTTRPIRTLLRGGPSKGGYSVVLSHFPYAGESDPTRPDRYTAQRPQRPRKSDPNPWLLHGHVHEQWCVHGTQINVGVDVWDFAPVHADVVAALIDGGPQ